MSQTVVQYGSTPGKSTPFVLKATGPDLVALGQLADFLDQLPPSQFDFCQVVSEWETEGTCGSVCCAIGWCPKVFPEKCRWGGTYEWPTVDDPRVVITTHRGSSFKDWAMKIFRLADRSHASKLFCPGETLPWFHWNQKGSWSIGRPMDMEVRKLPDMSVPETPKNVAASLRAYVRWTYDGMPIDPYAVLTGPYRKS